MTGINSKCVQVEPPHSVRVQKLTANVCNPFRGWVPPSRSSPDRTEVALMANYVITCVIKSDNPASSAFDSRGCHITDGGFGGAQTMTVKEVYVAMASGCTL